MIINVPKKVEKEFLGILDILQTFFITEEELAHFTKREKQCIVFIEKMLERKGIKPSRRYKTRQEARMDYENFMQFIGRT